MMKGLFAAPPGAPILHGVAAALANETGGDLEQLRHCTLLLPTRRSIRILEEMLLDAFALPTVLLPTIMAIGDIEIPADDTDKELPPPRSIEGIERVYSLLPFLEQHDPGTRRLESRWHMAEQILRLIDLLQTEDLEIDAVDRIAPADLAIHWQNNIGLFKRVAQDWLIHLKNTQRINSAAARTARIRQLITRWQDMPPTEPLWLIGSTGSIPVVRDLMRAVLKLERGAVLLPGVDLDLPDDAWEQFSDAHPQAILKNTLGALGYDRRELSLWPHSDVTQSIGQRSRYLSAALSPLPCLMAPDTHIALVQCEHEQEEFSVIAQICADALHSHPNETITIIGNDPALSARLTPLLTLYGIDSDTSAGYKIGNSQAGLLLSSILQTMLNPDNLVLLWGLLKNPSFYPAWNDPDRPQRLATIERQQLRDALICPGSAGLLLDLLDNDAGRDLQALLQDIQIDRPLAQWALFLQNMIGGFIEARGAEDHAVLDCIHDALQRFQSIRDTRALSSRDALSLLHDHIVGLTYRLPRRKSPSVTILGTMEARLMKSNLTIISGLNEGTWPDSPLPSPFLSRAMRHTMGLPDTERHAALSGHDFQQAFLNPEIIMTRARQGADGPTLPARWLLQMQAVTPQEEWAAILARGDQYRARLNATHMPDCITPAAAPAPTAGFDDIGWPLSMSAIETWRGDPFSFWATRIARLRALDPVMPDINAASRGTVWHDFLKRFVRRFDARAMPDVQMACFETTMNETLNDFGIPDHKKRLWSARLNGAAQTLIDEEISRQRDATPTHLEEHFEGAIGPYALKARADRIDTDADEHLILYDYKTGQKPTKEEIRTGMKCQLSLLALILERDVKSLSYLSIKGGRTPTDTTQIAWDNGIAQETASGFTAWCEMFLNNAQPFACHADFDDAAEKVAQDYLHLARYQEWGGRS